MSNQIKEWLSSVAEDERSLVAESAGTSVAYLYQLAGGHRKASLELADRLQTATKGKLTISGVRPDLLEVLNRAAS